MTSCLTRPPQAKEVITIDFEPQVLCTDMPLFKPVDRFNNNVLFQATKDHSAGQGFDVTKEGNRDSNILVCAVIIVGSVYLLGSLLVLTEATHPQVCKVASKLTKFG